MRYAGILVLLLMAALANAQNPAMGQYGRFVIGVDNVAPSTPMPYPNLPPDGTYPHHVVDAQANGGAIGDIDTWIPWQRWLQMTDLDLDLAIVTLADAAVHPTRDGAEHVVEYATDNGIDVGFSDMGTAGGGIYAHSGMMREYHHLESSRDMENTHPSPVTNGNFNPDNLALDRFPLDDQFGNNAVRYNDQNPDPVMWGYLSRWRRHTE